MFSDAQDSVDEFTFSEKLGSDEASKRLNAHWANFYTEADFAEMASYGLNHIRLPVGYWAYNPVPGEPFVSKDQLQYVDQIITWAGKYGLYVLLDLHGAAGSQNGFDNSGRFGEARWQLGDNVKHTLDTLEIIAQTYLQDPRYNRIVSAICILNEPASFKGLDVEGIKSFYKAAYAIVRKYNPSTVLSLSDAFLRIPEAWNGFMNPEEGFDVSLLRKHWILRIGLTMCCSACKWTPISTKSLSKTCCRRAPASMSRLRVPALQTSPAQTNGLS